MEIIKHSFKKHIFYIKIMIFFNVFLKNVFFLMIFLNDFFSIF